MKHFLIMGGYAQYVWPVYGLAFIILLANGIYTKNYKQKIINKLKRFYSRQNNNAR